MATQRSGLPYIWVTWLTKLMVGESSCEWKAWFKAHHENRSWEKSPVSYGAGSCETSLAEWQMRHTAKINDTRCELEATGSRVFTENQNAFQLRGRTAVLGGKPDLIALTEGDGAIDGAIIDVKTGKPSRSHSVQVMLYMYAIPRALGKYKGMTFNGQVVYPDHTEEIPAAAVNDEFIRNLGQLICRISGGEPARRVPSFMECRTCEITAADCPDRVMEDPGVVAEGETQDF